MQALNDTVTVGSLPVSITTRITGDEKAQLINLVGGRKMGQFISELIRGALANPDGAKELCKLGRDK